MPEPTDLVAEPSMAPATVRAAFAEAAGQFLDVVRQVREDQWALPALGEWNVRDLVGHTVHSMTNLERYAEQAPATADISSTAEYYALATKPIDGLSMGSVGATQGDPASISRSGKEAGKALGNDPCPEATGIVHRVLAFLESLSDEAIMGTRVGGLRLKHYLPTRVLEVTVHTLDTAYAIDLVIVPPALARQVTMALLAEAAAHPSAFSTVVRGLTGRQALPNSFRLLS